MKPILNKKGLTLMEVIISLFIFTILSVGFYSLFTNVYINTYKTSNITEKTFLAQRELEDEIANTKEKIIKEQNVGYDLLSFDLFSSTPYNRNVEGYYLATVGDASVHLATLVAATRPPELKVPKVNQFSISGYQVNSGITSKVKYPAVGMNNLSLDIEGSLSTNNDGLLIRYVYYWYISDGNSYIPYEEPTFPDNYALIPGETTRTLSNIKEEYGGRFIKLVVTPVGEKGRMGESVFSNSIFISQLGVYDNLRLRLDASYFLLGNSDQVHSSGNQSFVNRWIGIVPEDMRNTNASTNRPLIESKLLIGENSEHWIRQVTGNSTDNRIVVIDGTSNQKSSMNTKQNSTIYFSLNLNEVQNNSITLLQGGSTSGNNRWYLQYQNNQLTLTKYISSSTRPSVSVNLSSFEPEMWLHIKLELYDNLIGINVNNEVFDRVVSDSGNFNNIPLTITVNNRVSIGDLLIYDAKHDDVDRDEVFEYFLKKYNPN